MNYRAKYMIVAAGVLLVAGLMVSMLVFAPEAALASPIDDAQQGVSDTGTEGGPDVPQLIKTVTNILLFVVGIAAVIMVIVGAIKYVTASGDQSSITSAKNTILYSIIGLVLALAAGAIVNFVLDQF